MMANGALARRAALVREITNGHIAWVGGYGVGWDDFGLATGPTWRIGRLCYVERYQAACQAAFIHSFWDGYRCGAIARTIYQLFALARGGT